MRYPELPLLDKRIELMRRFSSCGLYTISLWVEVGISVSMVSRDNVSCEKCRRYAGLVEKSLKSSHPLIQMESMMLNIIIRCLLISYKIGTNHVRAYITQHISLYYFFSGICFKMSTKWFQNFSTVGINMRSSGECTPCNVGPNEIISNVGYLSRNKPHSNPA